MLCFSRTYFQAREYETYSNSASTTVGYCHLDHGCKIAAKKLRAANGLVKSRTNDTVYVASSLGGGISVMAPQADHTLTLIDRISTCEFIGQSRFDYRIQYDCVRRRYSNR